MSKITSEFMAPLSGAESIQFLHDTSCSKSIAHIRIPVLCLNSRDDPLFPGKYLPIQQVKESKCVSMFVTSKGGHLAWLENEKDEYGEFEPWFVSIVVEYFRAMSNVILTFHVIHNSYRMISSLDHCSRSNAAHVTSRKGWINTSSGASQCRIPRNVTEGARRACKRSASSGSLRLFKPIKSERASSEALEFAGILGISFEAKCF